MRSPSAHELLELWETGQSQRPPDRALTVIAACSGLTREDLAGLSLGQRDALLLDLREKLLGPRLSGFTECPQCAERLELNMSMAEIATTQPEAPREAHELVSEGISLRFRLPDSRDLLAVADCRDPAEARGLLVRRCVLHASREGRPLSCEELPPEAVSRLGQRMAECDPAAEVLLDLRCPACGHGWQALLDIAAFLWTELAARARRLLQEVHTLARAYGWRESDILAMSGPRRQCYLELAEA